MEGYTGLVFIISVTSYKYDNFQMRPSEDQQQNITENTKLKTDMKRQMKALKRRTKVLSLADLMYVGHRR